MINDSYMAEKAWDNLYDSEYRSYEDYDLNEQLRQEALEDAFQREREEG